VTKSIGFLEKSVMSWPDAGKNNPDERHFGKYFCLSASILASSYSRILLSYSNLLASSSAYFLFLGGI